MAEILIHGMEMPRQDDVFVQICADGVAVIFKSTGEPRAVKVVELSEHGDLIDKQATFKALSEKFKSSDGLVSWTDAIDIVLRALVVIPANKETK